MAEIDLNGFIEVEDSELATSGGIDVSQLEEEDTSKTEDKTENKTTEETNLIEVKDTEENTSSNTEETNTDESNTQENEEEEINAFHAFSILLKDKGVFPNINDEAFKDINDADSIINLLNSQLDTVNTTWQTNYKQHLVQNLINDGVIKADQVVNQTSKRYSLDDIKGNETAAKATIQAFYKSKDVPESQINTIIDGTLDVEEEALKLQPLLIQADKQKEELIAQRVQNKEQEQLQQQNSFNDQLRKTVYEYKEFIPGRTLSDIDKEDVVNRIPTVLDKINKDLGKFAPILAYLDKYGLIDGDVTKIINEVETKGTSTFEKALNGKKRGNTNNTSQKNVNALTGSGVPQIYK